LKSSFEYFLPLLLAKTHIYWFFLDLWHVHLKENLKVEPDQEDSLISPSFFSISSLSLFAMSESRFTSTQINIELTIYVETQSKKTARNF
jgi:hypothetical protein